MIYIQCRNLRIQKKPHKTPKSYNSERTTVNNLAYFLKIFSLQFYILHR